MDGHRGMADAEVIGNTRKTKGRKQLEGIMPAGSTSTGSRQSAASALRDTIMRKKAELEELEALLAFLESQPTISGSPVDAALWRMVVGLRY